MLSVSNCGYASSSRRRAMVAPLAPGLSGKRPWNGLATVCVRNVSAALSRIALCVRNSCGTKLSGSTIGRSLPVCPR